MRDERAGETTLFDGPASAAGPMDLGSLAPEAFGAIRVTGFAGDGARVVEGETLALSAAALAGGTLDVFVQRVGAWARVPSASTTAPPARHAVVLGGRYVMSADGTASAFYDLLFSREVSSATPLPRPAESLVASGARALLIDRSGATLVDYSSSRATAEIAAPDGAAFDSVAGGATVVSADGDSFVVGGTRADDRATASILRVRASGVVDWARTTTERLGACATHVPGRGLVVAGGAAAGSGAELLGEGAPSTVPLAYAPLAAAECAVTPLGPDRVVLAAFAPPPGDARLTTMRLDCAATACALEPFGPSLPEALTTPQLQGLPDASVLVTGRARSGTIRAFRVSAESVREIALPEPRAAARLLMLPTGSVALVGGAPSIATFRP